MRQPIQRHPGFGAVARRLIGVSKLLIFDVRVLGAIGAALIGVVTLSIPNPEEIRAPARLSRGMPGVHNHSLAFSTTGKYLAAIMMDGQVTLRTPSSREQTQRFLEFPGFARTISFSPDDRSVAVAGLAPVVYLWDLSSRSSEPASVMALPIRQANRIMFSPDGRSFAVTAGFDGTILLWDLARGQERMTLHHPSPVVSLAFSPDGRRLAVGGDKRSLFLWDLQTGLRRILLVNESGPTHALAFSPDGSLLASAGDFENHIRLWDLNTLREYRVFAKHSRPVSSVAFSPDGSFLATAGHDGTVGLWTVATGHRQVRLDGQATLHLTVAFSPDGQTLALATGDDDDIRLWSLADLF